jgi:hypothetical protein
MANLWDTVRDKARGPAALTLFVVGCILFVFSVVLSYEDATSSLRGLQLLESTFGVTPVANQWVLYVMALTPQVAQVAFLSIWTFDTRKWWWLVAAIVAFAIDFIFDVQLRSSNTLFTPGGVGVTPTAGVGAMITLLFFSPGAEIMMTASTVLIISLFPQAIEEARSQVDAIMAAAGRGGRR